MQDLEPRLSPAFGFPEAPAPVLTAETMDAWRTFAGQLIERSLHEARSSCRKLVERSPPLREVVPRCLRFSPAALQQALLVSPLTATLNKVRRLTSYAAEEPHPLLSHPLLHRVLSACTPRALGRLALASSECAERVGHHLSKPDAWAEFAAAKAKATPDLLELLIGATLRLEPAAMVSRLQSCFKAFDAYDLAAESESGGVRVTLALSQLETSVLAEVGTHRPWMWIDDEGVADACPELLGRCVLASLKRKKFSADDLAACFVAWHAPEGYERWSDWCTDQEAFYDAIGRFCVRRGRRKWPLADRCPLA